MQVDEIYEKLSESSSLRSFITISINIFDQAVDQLINRVFRKTDFAVKSVVDSLFITSGPLFELNIRLKVLLGLGVISHEIFQDINIFLTLKEKLNNDEKEYLFTDAICLTFIQNLHSQMDKSLFPSETQMQPEKQDSLSHQIKQLRLERLVRSSLILCVGTIYEQLQIESPL